MKRLAAILLLSILLFNVFGYQLVIISLQSNNAIALEKKLDKNDFSDAELISVKTKLYLPYYQSSEVFERAYGSINIDGKDYEFVKRRVHNDTLELLCLPDKKKTALNDVKNGIAKSSADHQSNTPAKRGTGILKLNLLEYLPTAAASIAFEDLHQSNSYNITTDAQILFGFHTRLERPPQLA